MPNRQINCNFTA